ncbi:MULTISPECIES: bifunctional phosphoribosylaminoimidazolecarboxamide formyltransferase/IMP cyclohydrolase [unclassified Polaromonas]|jgi:phosphoribosylaminoimidazolecarboxamide formyltransferase/IMP cyclohydrolase|uniref:bifunctional phosphoribosylaminoimidazolecarboxamide formyltransferase/IMP cyclohydrolase n=1 Tax=unclassified Polaromonas TaxID=2638319 RepID=UPI000BDB518E|nr:MULTISPECIES: bifunctional phosphoribosylaminoimidazolecarboxamide formyltransferase/IMP cyclohydrolase [unclassified Polaromonas]OYY36463.1 MAG: bifunctional phosphoribosylaminoimidazolecarboxamide formyltransferase/IMP cyclohydrolase [Polaromonas sp. 35-63-35]OYZ22698.1 MAG: bifunctional phosphoribosylaminoimidazolecarboxamide formyltransferase/IMP cyclohydrolase [Polaromonas sp. 16-63-31]OYZ81089.1 MAG: bifunctional phosphoribosylaminoimidazolecarboxamide formyltransferase/IMP cyclohydrola
MNALISVSDKTGIVDFARALHALGIKLISTGGTAKLLADEKLPVTEVAELTGFPEMLDGRVKTLHPMVHGGLLARRDVPEHMAALKTHGIGTIDLLVVNLYPFEATVAKAGCTLEDAIENIDIGGPAMVRSAAKNWKDVGVLTDASQYAGVLEELKSTGKLADATKFALSVAAFNRISQYDGAISDYLSGLQPDGTHSLFPGQANGRFIKVQELRYGENSHQQAALYRDLYPAPGSLVTARQLQGKGLSYNNIADADAAWECVKSFNGPACVIVKHANPCGVAIGADALEAYSKAFKTDPTSAFGGIIALNCTLDGAAAQQISKQFVEVLMAPAFTPEALEVFKTKVNVRILQIDLPPGGDTAWQQGRNLMDIKRVGSGLLMQTADNHELALADIKVVSKLQPTPAQLQDLLFAWKVAKYVKSNAIVFCADGMTMGVGAGQMSRLDSARIASIKAGHAGLSLKGTVVASDAFFPFRDGLDVVVDAGANCVIQPGGSMRDQEVIDAADERGVVMVLSGVRHFRH